MLCGEGGRRKVTGGLVFISAQRRGLSGKMSGTQKTAPGNARREVIGGSHPPTALQTACIAVTMTCDTRRSSVRLLMQPCAGFLLTLT
jgi:hypothetical protein